MTFRVAICGTGAIGGYYGAAMIRAGHDVTLIDPWPENVETIRRAGLTIAGMSEGDQYTVPAHPLHIGDVQGLVRQAPFEAIFIALKAYDTAWSTRMMLEWLAPGGVMVALQNSYTEPTIAEIAGPERTYGCAITALACEMTGPGLVRRLSPDGHTIVGALTPEADADGAKTARLAELLACVDTATPTRNLAGVKWSKLVVNSMRNGLSGLTGMSGRERDNDPATVRLGMMLGAQAVQTGRAMGLELVNTSFDFEALEATARGDAAAIAAMAARMAEIAAARGADQRPSMGQDIRKGRRTETDWINGLVARHGRAHGVEVSAHEQVNARMHRIERGALAPSPLLAREILEALGAA